MTGWLKAFPEPMNVRVMTPQVNLPEMEQLLPLALLCGISILCTLLWLLAEWNYTTRHRRHVQHTASTNSPTHARPGAFSAAEPENG